MTLNETEV